MTFYNGNRAGGSVELDTDQLAQEFVAALRGEAYPDYRPSGRSDLESEYRWFLGHAEVRCLTWDEERWPEIYQPLIVLLNGDDEIFEAVMDGISSQA